MTACVNKKSKRVAAVVTASLVGALSIGAPAVALATGTTSIDMLAADWTTGAALTAATDNSTALSGDLTKITFTEGKQFLVPTHVKSKWVEFDVTPDMLSYSKDGGFSDYTYAQMLQQVDGAKKLAAGTYKVTVEKDGKSVSFPFRIVAASTELTMTAVQNGDVDDTTFTYTGSDLAAANGIQFLCSNGKVYKSGDSNVAVTYAKAGKAETTIINAGDYVATVTVTGDVTGTFTVPFTVEKLDLSKASFGVNASRGGGIKDVQGFLNRLIVNGAAEGYDYKLAVTKVVDPNGGSSFSTSVYGPYAVTVEATDVNSNVTGSAVVSYDYLQVDFSANANATLKYGKKATSSVDVDLADGESFDASKLSIDWKSGDNTVSLKGDDLQLSYFKYSDGASDKKGDVVTADALKSQGKFVVSVRAKAFQDWYANDAWTGGAKDLVVNVTGNTAAAEDVAFFFDGELAGSEVEPTYDGTDQFKKLSVKVNVDGKELVEGTDYTLEYKLGAKEVTEAVDAGEYTVTLKPITFTAGAEELTIDVQKVDLKVLVAATETTKEPAQKDGKLAVNGQEYYVRYTGSAVEVPGVKYEVYNEKAKTYSYVDLDTSLYKVLYLQDATNGFANVDEAKEADHTYKASIVLTDAASKNYELNDSTFSFTIREYGHFTDVDSAEWYSVPVEKAYEEGCINGISGTNLFAPKTDITRADAICILFNMAGGVIGNSDFSYNENTGYETGFNDVDGHAYFAKALAWAKASGVANGSNGQFRPLDKITREEFVSLLANFAKSKGDYEAVDADSVLGSATDYTAWAKANVAWPKANGIMGNNGAALDGTGKITRAQVTAMAVNYQPENLTGFVRGPEGTMVDPETLPKN
jgi:hypothetical protein